MSETTSENRGGSPNRRRSRGGRSRNRNQQGNRSQDENRQGGRSRNRSHQRGEGGESRQRRQREPKPKPLTWWQKLLKAIGLYKEPARPQSGPKSNTRIARTGDAPTPATEGKPRERRPRREPAAVDNSGTASDVETKRIYLGNLSYETTESDLEELFKGVGTVRRVEIVYDRRTHRSKGYGFVEMLNVDEAKQAVEILHDQFFMGRKLTVSGAKSQGPADGSAADPADEGSHADAPTPEQSQPPAEPQGKDGTKPD